MANPSILEGEYYSSFHYQLSAYFWIQHYSAFAEHSWYFRNALVRANYNNLQQGIFATTEFLEKFFQNLLLGEHHELKNRSMLISVEPTIQIQSSIPLEENSPKCKNCTLEEMAVIKYLNENPHATQKEIAQHIGKSERTVKTITVNLSSKGFIERKNGCRNGFWEVKV